MSKRSVATRILFDGDRATGVTYRRKGVELEATARREVLVAAGAIESPKLLQLSGVGNGADLAKLGIDIVVDNPGVGRNLQEHPTARMVFGVNVPTLNTEMTVQGVVRGGAQFVGRGAGAATSPPTHAFIYGKTSEESDRADYELYFGPFGITPVVKEGAAELLLGHSKPMPTPAISIGIEACHPTTRGTVSLRSASVDDTPVIEHQLLSDPEIEVMRHAGREARRVVDAAAFRGFVTEELAPGPQVQSDDDWEAWLREKSGILFHPVGTCRMGDDAGAVVDPELRVNGVQGLRVVDASVMPTQVTGHTNAAVVMIAERAADLVRASATTP